MSVFAKLANAVSVQSSGISKRYANSALPLWFRETFIIDCFVFVSIRNLFKPLQSLLASTPTMLCTWMRDKKIEMRMLVQFFHLNERWMYETF